VSQPSYNVRPDMRATVYVHVDPKSQNSKGTGGVMIGTGGIIAVIARNTNVY
jgi:hypothetical protein